ncbi:hypothetical protein OVN20_06100 [Microcella daejeonensis]|uniref:hypothetical protein n=1 Tax=Microcella daejeonensis TaxID=2994971 RepID=UPI00226D467B|nr:hypothetical protein [Microcella daejeonensis]WAB85119.1 hypothetical protein OVN20_06100 [Microcella daejeonensis]
MPLPTLAALPVLLLALVGCSGPEFGADTGLDGCVAGTVGSIGLGVVNSSGDPISIDGIEANRLDGAEVIDRWFAAAAEVEAIDDGESVVFGGDRASSPTAPVDLDGIELAPGEAGYVTIAIERTGEADGVLDGVRITTDGRELPAPVALTVSDSCG